MMKVKVNSICLLFRRARRCSVWSSQLSFHLLSGVFQRWPLRFYMYAVQWCVERPALRLAEQCGQWGFSFLLMCIFILISEVVVLNQTMNLFVYLLFFYWTRETECLFSVLSFSFFKCLKFLFILTERTEFLFVSFSAADSPVVFLSVNFCVSVIFDFFYPAVWTVSQQLRAFQFHAWIPQKSSSDIENCYVQLRNSSVWTFVYLK